MVAAGSKLFHMVEPEICVPVPQTPFAGQASSANNTVVLSFKWT